MEDCLKPCLESIRQYTTRKDIEVLVVANGCKDGTRAYVESLGDPFKLLWFDEPLGYTKATNEGIKAAKGEYLCLMNNDVVLLGQPPDTWLQMLEAPFANPKCGITGPMKAYSPETGRMFVIFFLVMFKKELIDKFGLLDESFSPGFGEDTDFCLKIENAGYEIVQVPDYECSISGGNFMVGHFPLYHKGEGTFANWPGGEELLRHNRNILMSRYGQNIKLNLGSADKHLDGYISVDLFDDKADLKLDARKLDYFRDGTVNEILSVHLIEHISPFDVGDMLKEWFRVLKPTGKVVIECPDVLEICKHFEDADKGERYRLINCLYGTGNGTSCPHLFGWYPEILTDHLAGVGFTNIEVMPPKFDHWGYNMRIEASKPKIDTYPEGFFSDENAIVYREMAEAIPDGGTMIEVGVWKGRSICMLSDIIQRKRLQVIAVDHFKGSVGEGDEGLRKEAEQKDIEQVFRKNLDTYGIGSQVRLIRATSLEAAKQIHNESVDLIFIDANHGYQEVKADILAWFPKIKQGGIMGGHDFANFCGVPLAVTEVFGSDATVENDVWRVDKRNKKTRIYDCFPFYNELELLEIRLNEMAPICEKVIIVEATKTHSGRPKPLYFEQNKHLFSKWKDKIVHIVTDFPDGLDVWGRERYQREQIMRGLTDCHDDDAIIISDADEIPRASAVITYKTEHGIRSLDQDLHYYFLNTKGGIWKEAKILPYGTLKQIGPCGARYTNATSIPNGGWHFSYLGGEERIIDKINSWAHQEYNRDDIKDVNNVREALATGRDLFKRPDQPGYTTVQIDDTYPAYIVSHKQEYIEKKLIKV